MTIDVLVFEGCPNAEPAVDLIRRTLAELGVSADVRRTAVADAAHGEDLRFLGSPTIQVDGLDVEVARRTDPPAFTCRVYRTGAATSGVPPARMLVEAIEAAR